MPSPSHKNCMRYLSAVCFGLVAASAAAHAQTAGNPVQLYQYGVAVGTPANPLTVSSTSAGAVTAPGTPSTAAETVQGNASGIPVFTTPPTSTAAVCSASTITTGGTAINFIGAGIIVHGAMVINPLTATEPLFINLVGAATLVASGTTFALAAGQSYTVPTPMTVAISGNATTSGHLFTCFRW